MPRSLMVVINCENCDAAIEGENHEGSLVLDINGGGPRQIDLCRACMTGNSYDEVFPEQLLDLYAEAAPIPNQRRTKRAPVARGEHPCPVQGCDSISPTTQGLGRHTRAAHDLSLKEARAQHG